MITLRPQQVVFENAIREAFRKHRRVLGVAATGFGKGVVFADMAFKAVHDKNRTVLGVTNRRAVVRQLADHCLNAGIRVGIIMGNDEPDPDAPVQVASIQTLKRRDFVGLKEPGFILVDEAHQEHDAYKKLLTERFPHVPALGFTATPVGPGGARIGHFQTIVEPIKNSEVISAGDLLKVHPYKCPSEPDLGGIDLKRISKDELGQRVEACTIYGDVFKLWEPFCDMQTMIVLPSRAVCNQMLKICRSKGLTAKVVDGTTRQEERDETFSEFKAEDCQMLLGVDVVREGLDLPIAQCLIDLQPTHQLRVYWQKLGRIKRPHEGQDTAVVIDLAGNLWRHMIHPDQDPPWEELTKDNTIEEIIERKKGVRCPECGSKNIYGPIQGQYKCEDCGHQWATKKPWVCPECHQTLAPWQKVIGGKCPNCGAQVSTKPVRRIRMVDGSIRTVSADEVKKRKKSKANSDEQKWINTMFMAFYARRKNPHSNRRYDLAWCAEMFRRDMGRYPPSGIKLIPEKGSKDWKREPDKVYPFLFHKAKARSQK